MLDRYTKSQLVGFATGCYVAYHKENHALYDRFKVEYDGYNGVRLVPFLGVFGRLDSSVLTFIVDYLNKCNVNYYLVANGNRIFVEFSSFKP